MLISHVYGCSRRGHYYHYLDMCFGKSFAHPKSGIAAVKNINVITVLTRNDSNKNKTANPGQSGITK